MESKGGIRAEKAKETKEKIYKSAVQLFGERSFDEVSVNSIVKLAGVAKGSFYVHFDSKDALIFSFISDYVNRVDFGYRTFIESLPDDLLASDIILLFVEKIADTITEIIGYPSIRTLYKIQLTRDTATKVALDYNRDLYKLFAQLIDIGIDKGEFNAELSSDSLAKLFVMSYRGLAYEWCIRYPDFDLKKEALNHFRILIKGIKN